VARLSENIPVDAVQAALHAAYEAFKTDHFMSYYLKNPQYSGETTGLLASLARSAG